MASARRHRRHHRLQFSGRRLVVERGPGRGLRRRDRLEAVGENAAHRHRRDQDRGARLSRDGRRSGDFFPFDWRPQNGRRKAGGGSPHSARFRDRFGAHGDRRSPGRSMAVSAAACWSWAATTRSSFARAPISKWRRSRFSSAPSAPPGSVALPRGASSLHESIADKVRAKLLAAYKSVAIGNPLDEKTLMGPLIDRRRSTRCCDCDQAIEGRRRRGSLRRRATRRRRISRRLLHDALPGQGETRFQDRARRNLRAAALPADLPRFRRSHRDQQRRAAGI